VARKSKRTRECVVLTKKEVIDLKDIPDEIKKEAENTNARNLKPLKELELETVIKAIDAFKGNKSKAAKALGITRKALYSRLKQTDFKS
jgi:two-component system response regulator HydG